MCGALIRQSVAYAKKTIFEKIPRMMLTGIDKPRKRIGFAVQKATTLSLPVMEYVVSAIYARTDAKITNPGRNVLIRRPKLNDPKRFISTSLKNAC